MLRLVRLRDYLRSSLWFLPMLLVFVLVLLAAGLAYLDSTVVSTWGVNGLYRGSAEGARSVLATIATSMLSLAALVFTITLVVLQLAASQLSPRVITLFLQDTWTKVAMGVFLGTFAYALTALWLVTAPTESYTGFVPILMITVALALVAVSVLVFINYVHRVSQSIRVENVTREIAEYTVASVRTMYAQASNDGDATESGIEDADREADRLGDRAQCGHDVLAPRTGLVVGISLSAAMRWARANDAVVRVLAPLSAYVSEGMAIACVYKDDENDVEFPLEDIISVNDERSIGLDPAYGLRQLTDIALRALSPGVNEPGTAVVVLDHIQEILLRVGGSSLPGPVFRDDEGDVRVIVPRLSWEGWLALALREIMYDGRESVQVCRRLEWLVASLTKTLPQRRHHALRRYAEEIAELPGSQRPYVEWAGLMRGGDEVSGVP